MTSTPTKPLTLTSLVGCRHTIDLHCRTSQTSPSSIPIEIPSPISSNRFHLPLSQRRKTISRLSSDSIKPFDYTSSPPPEAPPLPGPHGACSSCCSELSYADPTWFLKEITRDIHSADGEWRIILLRYFNPIGAHESGKLGEDPIGIPNNLMPYTQKLSSC
ncbi:unnamed protein product [Lactuca saligna]|uniref:Uncharacterized protein n=1 Tax=Lactuca saligna TaxID=75948 RepID=A0AA35VTZ9_LACSI|nr:unnamed protein product [Lactuca saligna]